MKRSILILSLAFVIVRCSKENSLENYCGTVKEKKVIRGEYHFIMDNNGRLTTIHVGLVPYGTINIGEQYCY